MVEDGQVVVEQKVEAKPDNGVEKAVAEAVALKEKEWQEAFNKKVNEASAAERKKYEAKLREATMTETEKAQAAVNERLAQVEQEAKEYKQKLFQITREKAIAEAGLPKMFLNDKRLDVAEDGELENVIKQFKIEHEELKKEILKSAVGDTGVKQTGKTVTPKSDIDPELAKKYPHLRTR
jgi:uncharacterized protein